MKRDVCVHSMSHYADSRVSVILEMTLKDNE